MTASWWACSLLACAPALPPVAVEHVRLDTPRELDACPDQRDRLRRGLEAHLHGDPSVVDASNRGQATHVLQVAVTPPASAWGAPGDRVLVAELRPLGAAADYRASVAVDGEAEPVDALLAGFARAWDRIASQRRLDAGPEAALFAAIAGEDPGLRDFAIARAGERRLRRALPALSGLLRDDVELGLALRVAGALTEIGSRRAVPALIALSHQKPPAVVAQLALAIGALGGRQATAYLVTVATGHEDAAVRQAATDALAASPPR